MLAVRIKVAILLSLPPGFEEANATTSSINSKSEELMATRHSMRIKTGKGRQKGRL